MLRSLKQRLNRNNSSSGSSAKENAHPETTNNAFQQQQVAPEPRRPSAADALTRSLTEAFGLTLKGNSSMHNAARNNYAGMMAPVTEDISEELLTIQAKKTEHALSKFDACLEAADALAAGGAEEKVFTPRVDKNTGLNDCSVLISADGDLLFTPSGQHDQEGGKSGMAVMDDLNRSSEEYGCAVYHGSDLDPLGDKARNGFSAKGWSIPATSVAIKQTEQGLSDLTHFCEQLVTTKKEAAARDLVTCDGLRCTLPSLGGRQYPPSSTPLSTEDDDWECVEPPRNDWDPSTPRRVGPLMAPQSTLNRAIVAMEEYYAGVADSEANRWRLASLHNGFLPKLREATTTIADRARKRQAALDSTSQRARYVQQRLDQLKRSAELKWQAVYQAEDRVSKRVEDIMHERSREREQKRLEDLRKAEEKRRVDAQNGELGATSEEIWDLVSRVAESMDSGSFEPMDLPSAPLTLPRDRARRGEGSEGIEMSESSHYELPVPVVSRELIEIEMGLPELRASAMQADEDVANAADAMMSLLSSLDITRRSARVAAETCLVSAGQSQASCIKSLIEIERASLEEKLAKLKEVESTLTQVDVRADLNSYIVDDKKERGGSTHLGDDDDGGLASALAVLSRHVDGSMGSDADLLGDSQRSLLDDGAATPEMLTDCVEELFDPSNPHLYATAPDSEETAQGRKEFEDAVNVLCRRAAETGTSARARRSTICYALNAKRGNHTGIRTQIQFDALCRVFEAILTGCNSEKTGSVSNAKMCIMLAQTFFLAHNADGPVPLDAPSTHSATTVERSQRIFVKCRLKNHPLWLKDDFWDQALGQQISESLTHSGVMANFERSREHSMSHSSHSSGSDKQRKSEWTQTRKTKWYDLSFKERTEAASQVHAVVFAQLGALAHSMMEFGCGLERSAAFVRRMAIRNQLPSSQRTMLLLHLMDRDDVERQEEAASSLSSGLNLKESAPEDDEFEDAVAETEPTLHDVVLAEDEHVAQSDALPERHAVCV